MELTIKNSVSDTSITIWTVTGPTQRSSAELTKFNPEYLENLLSRYTEREDAPSKVALEQFTQQHPAFYFNRLFVHPAVRRKGVGSALCAALQAIVERDNLCVFLESVPYGDGGPNKAELLLFYKKNGFIHLDGPEMLMVPQSDNQFACMLGTTKGRSMSIRN